MAFSALLLHWFLFLVWGMALNDSGGCLYCRIVMPDAMQIVGLFTHSFTIAACVAITALGFADRRLLGLSARIAFYPLPLLIITQILLAWALFSTTRY